MILSFVTAVPLLARCSGMQILHYTFGTAKPWHWWTRPFLPHVITWVQIYQKLAPNGGPAPHQFILYKLFLTVITAILPGLFIYGAYRLACQNQSEPSIAYFIAAATCVVSASYFRLTVFAVLPMPVISSIAPQPSDAVMVHWSSLKRGCCQPGRSAHTVSEAQCCVSQLAVCSC